MRRQVYPGDSVYLDEKGRIFKKAKKDRTYLGQVSLLSKKPMKEGMAIRIEV